MRQVSAVTAATTRSIQSSGCNDTSQLQVMRSPSGERNPFIVYHDGLQQSILRGVYNTRMATREAKTLSEMHEIAAACAGELFPRETATVLALQGDLGSGKTTFVQALARAYGVTEHVTSPTFVIQKIYPLKNQVFDRLVHIDAYRMESAHELDVLGWQELMRDAKALVCIEWPERVPGLIPDTAQRINFTCVDETTRRVDYM